MINFFRQNNEIQRLFNHVEGQNDMFWDYASSILLKHALHKSTHNEREEIYNCLTNEKFNEIVGFVVQKLPSIRGDVLKEMENDYL